MAQVSNQTELQTALGNRDNTIEVISNFSISSQILIQYEVTLSSIGGSVYTLTKDASYGGYMFRVDSGGSFTLQNVILDGDKETHPSTLTTNRALIFLAGGTLNLTTGSILQNNNSNIEGGGVYALGSANYTNTFLMNSNAKITGCTSNTTGGGLNLSPGSDRDSLIISDEAVIESNTASYGGGLNYRAYLQGVSSQLTIAGQVRITENSASGTGGGICFSGYRGGENPASSLTISENAVISSNTAVHGGGIYYYASNNGDQLNITGSASISGNTASQNGGGIGMAATTGTTGAVNFTLTDASITNNTAGTGGGLYLLSDYGADIQISHGIITGNSASNGASGTGGGMWIQNRSSSLSSSFSMADSTVEDNQATANGGGFALIAGSSPFSFLMESSSVIKNNAALNGGGIFMSSGGGGPVTFTSSAISQNTADGSGGGLYFANISTGAANTISMDQLTVDGNHAGLTGGGIRITSGQSSLSSTLTDCVISNNNAVGSGGGIWNGGSNDTLSLGGSTSVTQNTSEEGNGGGIYFNSTNGSLTLADQTSVTYNHADGIDSPTGNHGGGISIISGTAAIKDQTKISYNTALKYGGGISLAEQSVASMTGGSIDNNLSGQEGGGIWNHGGSVFTLDGGSIYNNKATLGGGIFNSQNASLMLNSGSVYGNTAEEGGGIYNTETAAASLTNSVAIGSQEPNTATEKAPGIYNQGTLYTDGKRDIVNGVYLENSSSVIRLPGRLEADSVISLDNSSYVTSNPEGTPIVIAESTDTYPMLTQADADAFQKPSSGFDGWEIRLSEDLKQILLAPTVYTITYENLMGAENPNPAVYTVETPAVILSPPGLISGYRFIGWFDALTGGSQITQIPQGSTGNLTLYARWERIVPEYVTITFCPNTGCGICASHIPGPFQIEKGQNVLIPDQAPTRCGFCFAGWNTDRYGCGTVYPPGVAIGPLWENFRLYAQWK